MLGSLISRVSQDSDAVHADDIRGVRGATPLKREL
jgi:hypothetical protein